MYRPYAVTEIAREFATKVHRETNHMYGDKHYDEGHLQKVFDIGLKYIHLIPGATDHKYILGGCWTHDTIEDARQTYSDVKKVCGKRVAELAFACTQSTGKTRAERQDQACYDRIRECDGATFIKLCDRIANVTNCVETGYGMFSTYRDEYAHFENQLYSPYLQPMWDELQQLLKIEEWNTKHTTSKAAEVDLPC